MHYFSNVFDIDTVLYKFRTCPLSIIRSFNTVYTATGICHGSYVDCLLADRQQNKHNKYLLRVYSVETPDDGQ